MPHEIGQLRARQLSQNLHALQRKALLGKQPLDAGLRQLKRGRRLGIGDARLAQQGFQRLGDGSGAAHRESSERLAS